MQQGDGDGGGSGGGGGGDSGGGKDGGSEETDTSQQVVEGGDDDMSELMSNREFLRSVLSSLPGVNPEEALQNLEDMTEQQEEEGDGKGEEVRKTESGV